jgi:hypothetical protein
MSATISVALISLLIIMGAGLPLRAATSNYPETAPGIQVIVLPIMGTITSTTTPVRWTTPFKMRVIGVSASARDVSGSATIDVKEAGASILSAAIACPSANVTYEGTISDSYIADEAAITIVFTLSGGSHITDATVILTVRRMY